MKRLLKKFINFIKISFSLILFSFFNNVLANEILIEINGNDFTDKDVILSLLDKGPEKLDEQYSNYIIKTLDNSQLFEDVEVKISDNKYIINIKEYSNINKIFFNNNERLKNEDLQEIASQINLNNTNPVSINKFISEIKNVYESFGYNNIEISYILKTNNSNISDIFFEIIEGKITKIQNIYFIGNNELDSQLLKNQINSKTKNLINIFANNNFKRFVVENDMRSLINFYKDNGFLDIRIENTIEYLTSNRVNLYFNIDEGQLYNFSSFKILNKNNLINQEQIIKIKNDIKFENLINTNFSINQINNIKNDISNLIIKEGVEFFEINSLQKIENSNVDIIYEINNVEPKYVKQINIYGNSRTFDKVIRRELNLSEGDPIYATQINQIKQKLKSLNLFNKIEIKEENIDDNLVNIIIDVEETQTGTINAGLSVGTLDGFAVVAGLSERNFYGTGRSLDFSVNTSEDKTQFTLQTTDRLDHENDINIIYRANYQEQDFAKSSSYELDTFSSGLGLSYKIIPKLRHNINLDYVIKNYKITDTNTVASSINNSSGENVSFVLTNKLYYSTVKSIFLPKDGLIINYDNFIETPSSSSNGYLKNIFTIKNYKKYKKIFFQIKLK